MFSRILLASTLLALPLVSFAQTPPCMNLLTQSAQAGVAAKVCQKQVNMETIAQLHQQNQCAAFFAQDKVKNKSTNWPVKPVIKRRKKLNNWAANAIANKPPSIWAVC